MIRGNTADSTDAETQCDVTQVSFFSHFSYLTSRELDQSNRLKQFLGYTVYLALLGIGCPKKKCLEAIFSTIKTTYNGYFFGMKIIDKVQSLSKFWPLSKLSKLDIKMALSAI